MKSDLRELIPVLPGRRNVLFCLGILICFTAKATEVQTDFSDGFGPWDPLHTGTWVIEQDADNPVAALIEPGIQRPPVRRPTAYLLLTAHVWRNVVFTLRAKSLESASVKNRDVVLIFGYIDDTHYYYAHIAASTDGRLHNVIMKVDGASRETIQREALPEARLGDGWHFIRVQHLETGEISVFVDDLESPLMTAMDADYSAGLVGFGSFDDRALFDDIRVTGELLHLETVEVSLSSADRFPMSLEFFGTAGFNFQVQTSSDLLQWESVGDPMPGKGSTITMRIAIPNLTTYLFRVAADPPALANS